MWQELEAICQEVGMRPIIERPPGAFTAAEYARQNGLNPSSARNRIRKLQIADKVEFVCKGMNNADFYRIKK